MIWKSQTEYSTDEKNQRCLSFPFFPRNVINEERLKKLDVNTEKKGDVQNERKIGAEK